MEKAFAVRDQQGQALQNNKRAIACITASHALARA